MFLYFAKFAVFKNLSFLIWEISIIKVLNLNL